MAIAQPWQMPVHAESQQRPLTQNPAAHSSAAPHGVPLGFVGAHVPPAFVVSQ
jgi:hypothetical protein